MLRNVPSIGKWRYVKDNTRGLGRKTKKKNSNTFERLQFLYPPFVFSSQPQEIKDLTEFLSLTTRVIHGIQGVREKNFNDNFFLLLNARKRPRTII